MKKNREGEELIKKTRKERKRLKKEQEELKKMDEEQREAYLNLSNRENPFIQKLEF